MESLIAGVRSGANAVYLGGKSFNARRNAGNFNDEELKKAVEYCHQRNVKVYLTLNILVSDGEMKEAYRTVENALKSGVDAFIVQDIGVAKMIKSHFKDARLHASTQMSVMTPSGVKAIEKAGFSRVVLPREMSLDEIDGIAKTTDLELELFVHGAHCMSVSGQCYMSAMIGTRSGNRGLCAQPCRLPFSAGKSNSFALSMKDLSIIKHLSKLGVITSLKIEGRMKRPEYVSAAVTAVKKAIENTYGADDEYTLKSVFSRSGFTDGYLMSNLGADMFGIRQKEDVTAAKNVLGEIRHNYENETPLVPIDFDFSCKENQNCVLKAQALGKNVTVTFPPAEKAINKPMTEESVKMRLAKLGQTQFFAKNISVDIDDGLIMPVSKLNEMRRQAVEKINEQETPQISSKPLDIILPKEKNSTPYPTAVFSNTAQIPENHPFKRIFIPLNSSVDDFKKYNAGAVLPRGLFGIESEVKSKLLKLKNAGVTKALCGNIGSYNLAEDIGFEVYGDFGLNIYNSISANEINSPILSFELTLSQINKINAKSTGIIAYGNVPLMLTRNCPVKNEIGCKNCRKNGFLTDRKGIKFPVVCSEYPCVEILNSVPIYMLDKVDEIKTDFIQFYFTLESKEQVESIIKMYEKREKPQFKYTRGLYKRGTE